ncbi:MAG: DUF4325 domain-containing protein [bacterium]
MKIEVKKFGTTLTSRQLGKEAFFAFQPSLSGIKKDEKVEIDFKGVVTFAPSWADEFLTPLFKKYKGRIKLKNTKNPSVKATLKLLEDINK